MTTFETAALLLLAVNAIVEGLKYWQYRQVRRDYQSLKGSVELAYSSILDETTALASAIGRLLPAPKPEKPAKKTKKRK